MILYPLNPTSAVTYVTLIYFYLLFTSNQGILIIFIFKDEAAAHDANDKRL